MSKASLADLVNLENETTAVNLINDNMHIIETAFENTLSRDGTAPNPMNARLDMNSNRILNLPSPVSPTEPVRLGDVNVNEVVVTKSRSFSSFAQAAASTIPLSVDMVQTLGYTTPGDNGDGNYVRTSNTDPAAWKFQSVDGQWWILTVNNASIRPEQLGASSVPLGTLAASVPDSTNAIQACAGYLATVVGGGTVQFSDGLYGVTSASFPYNSIKLKGSGEYTTTILHKPAAPSSCFVFSAGSSLISNCGIFDLTIASADTTLNKIAINVADASTFDCKNVTVRSYPFDGTNGVMYRGSGGTGIGMYIGGRELGRVENFASVASVPLQIGANLNFPAISLDSWTFHNCFFYTQVTTGNCVFIDNGVNLYNVRFSGSQNWIGGKDKLHWVDGTSTLESDGLYISGVKSEQSFDSTGYIINIQHNTGLKGFTFEDSLGGDCCGVKLRKVFHPKIRNYSHQQTSFEGLNIDATAQSFTVENCFWWAPSFITISGLTKTLSQPITTSANGSTTIPTDAVYSAVTTEPLNVNYIAAVGNVEANTFNNVQITHPASTAQLILGAGKALTVNNSLGLSGTDGRTHTFPSTNSTLARTDAAQTFTGTQTFSSTIAGDISGNAATATTTTTATNATNAVNVGITNDTTTNATMFPTWVTANTGNLPAKVTSTKLSFNPSTGVLSSTSFTGAGTGLTGTAASLTSGNVTTNANLTGDVTSVGNATTLTNAPVIAKVLTGYTSGSGTISASDSILSAIQKLNGNDATNANLTGDVTSVGNATTLTNAPVIAKVLTGYSASAGTVLSTDTILQAFQKLGGLVDNASWQSYSPAVTSQGGTFTGATITVTGRYKQFGKTIVMQADVLLTALGSGSPVNGLRVALPFTAANFNYSGTSTEILLTGRLGRAIVLSGSGVVDTRQYDGTSWISAGNQVIVTVVYEIP